MDEIRLSTGQPAQLRDGIVAVTSPPPHHYRLRVKHHSAAMCEARATRYEHLVALVKQFEALDYRLVMLEQVPGWLGVET